MASRPWANNFSHGHCSLRNAIAHKRAGQPLKLKNSPKPSLTSNLCAYASVNGRCAFRRQRKTTEFCSSCSYRNLAGRNRDFRAVLEAACDEIQREDFEPVQYGQSSRTRGENPEVVRAWNGVDGTWRRNNLSLKKKDGCSPNEHHNERRTACQTRSSAWTEPNVIVWVAEDLVEIRGDQTEGLWSLARESGKNRVFAVVDKGCGPAWWKVDYGRLQGTQPGSFVGDKIAQNMGTVFFLSR